MKRPERLVSSESVTKYPQERGISVSSVSRGFRSDHSDSTGERRTYIERNKRYVEALRDGVEREMRRFKNGIGDASTPIAPSPWSPLSETHQEKTAQASGTSASTPNRPSYVPGDDSIGQASSSDDTTSRSALYEPRE